MGLSEFLAKRAARSKRDSLRRAEEATAKAADAPAPGRPAAQRHAPIVQSIPHAASAQQPAKHVPALSDRPTPQPRFAVQRERMFDLNLTGHLYELFRVPMEQRDERWREAFLPAAWNASLQLPPHPEFDGPDGFPYYRLHIPAEGAFEPNSIANLAGQCVGQGRGIVLFASPGDQFAQYVFSPGVLDSLCRYDSWNGDPLDSPAAGDTPRFAALQQEGLRQFRTAGDHEVLLGTPSADLLPPATARSLYEHLRQHWNLAEPKVQLLVDPAMSPTRSLMVNRRMTDFDNPEHAAAECRALLWYLPPNRAVTLLPEGWSDENMTPLRELAG